MKYTGFVILFLSVAAFAVADAPSAPEIDGGSAASAVGLVAGTLMILRARRK